VKTAFCSVRVTAVNVWDAHITDQAVRAIERFIPCYGNP
jgi:hypothetical protein